MRATSMHEGEGGATLAFPFVCPSAPAMLVCSLVGWVLTSVMNPSPLIPTSLPACAAIKLV